MKIDDALHGISTLLLTTYQGKQLQGTGFFYDELGPKDPNLTEQWREIKTIWVATNRHVLLPKIKGKEITPEVLTFHLRKIVNNRFVWEPISLDTIEFTKRVRLHPNQEVDVALLQIDDLVKNKIKNNEQLIQYFAVSEENLPGNNNINAEVADDVIVVGYPKSFYDEVNVFPIVKSGIIASRWGLNFNGLPIFLIDAKLFPGSSGSIVITKPIDLKMVNGRLMHSKDKQFAFLGVYSGEPYREHKPIDLEDLTIIRKDSFNLGTVWYGHLIIEIAKNGVFLSQ